MIFAGELNVTLLNKSTLNQTNYCNYIHFNSLLLKDLRFKLMEKNRRTAEMNQLRLKWMKQQQKGRVHKHPIKMGNTPKEEESVCRRKR